MDFGKCGICNSQLQHQIKPLILRCGNCSKEEEAYIACSRLHYLCDNCLTKISVEGFYKEFLITNETNPLVIAEELITKYGLPGNSPHPLVTGSFLTALKNAGYKILSSDIEEGIRRATKIPGGWCGYYGNCGAATAIGVSFSIILKATPMHDLERSIANRATARVLEAIAEEGGPRCCVNAVRLSLETAISLAKEILNINLPSKTLHKNCLFSRYNLDCKEEKCRFYGKKLKRETKEKTACYSCSCSNTISHKSL